MLQSESSRSPDASDFQGPVPEDRPVLLSDVPWKWYDGLIGVGFLLPFRLLLLFPGVWLPEVVKLPRSAVPWALWVVIYLIPVAWRLLFPLCLASWRQPAFRFALPGLRVWFREGVVVLVILAALWSLLLAVLLVVLLAAGRDPAVPSVWNGAASAAHWSGTEDLLLSAMLVAPVAEELFFRGLVYNWLKRYLPQLAALGLQAAIFSLLHPFDVVHLAIAFVFGLALGAVYQWRKTLVAPILLHALQNVVASVAVAILAGK